MTQQIPAKVSLKMKATSGLVALGLHRSPKDDYLEIVSWNKRFQPINKRRDNNIVNNLLITKM